MHTFRELNEQGAYHPWRTEVRALGSSGVELIEMSKSAGEYADPATDRLLVVQCQTDNVRFTIDVGDGEFSGRAYVGDMVVVPPCAATSFKVRDDHEFRIVAFPSDLVGAPSGCSDDVDSIDPFAPIMRRQFRNDLMSQVLDRLWDMDGTDDRASAYGEAAGIIIGTEIAHEAGRAVPVESGGLSPRNVARACEFMSANLSRHIATAEVAMSVDMSPFHFTRQFKRSLGSSPQQWLTQRRIEVAKGLIRSEIETPIGEIAGRVGYQNKSAFGAVFAKVTGMTPGKFRRTDR